MLATRDGVSLVDTLIAVVCICITVGLLAPTLQQSRARSRADVCKDRLRQIALASHNFHDANKRLPPGTIGQSDARTQKEWLDKASAYFWKTRQNTASLALIMPFMGFMVEYESIPPIAYDIYTPLGDYPKPSEPAFKWQGDIPGAKDVATEDLTSFFCPADDIGDFSGKTIIATQPVNPFGDDRHDIAVQYWPDQASKLYGTNYVACHGALGGELFGKAELRLYRGCMTSSARVTLESVSDGTSLTIMYGETIGQIDDGERTSVQSWFWGGLARGRGDMPLMETRLRMARTMLGDETWSSAVGFGSKHNHGVNFGFADASVQQIDREVDWEVLYALCGARDGKRLINRDGDWLLDRK